MHRPNTFLRRCRWVLNAFMMSITKRTGHRYLFPFQVVRDPAFCVHLQYKNSFQGPFGTGLIKRVLKSQTRAE